MIFAGGIGLRQGGHEEKPRGRREHREVGACPILSLEIGEEINFGGRRILAEQPGCDGICAGNIRATVAGCERGKEVPRLGDVVGPIEKARGRRRAGDDDIAHVVRLESAEERIGLIDRALPCAETAAAVFHAEGMVEHEEHRAARFRRAQSAEPRQDGLEKCQQQESDERGAKRQQDSVPPTENAGALRGRLPDMGDGTELELFGKTLVQQVDHQRHSCCHDDSSEQACVKEGHVPKHRLAARLIPPAKAEVGLDGVNIGRTRVHKLMLDLAEVRLSREALDFPAHP